MPRAGNRGQYNKPPQPTDLTGRHVITNVDGIKNGGAQVVHWAPKDGTEWTCPDCGVQFVRDEERKGEPWRAVA